jgi:hypothetical protein
MTPEFLKSRLAELAQSSMNNFATINEQGDVDVDLKQAAALGALGQLKEIREETIEIQANVVKRKRIIKVHDPLPAIRTLAEMNGMLSGEPAQPERVVRRRQVVIGDAGDTHHN